MEEFIKQMRKLTIDNGTVTELRGISYTDFDGSTKTGTDAIVEMGADVATLNPNE